MSDGDDKPDDKPDDEPISIPAVRADDTLTDVIGAGDAARLEAIAEDSDDELIALLVAWARDVQRPREAE